MNQIVEITNKDFFNMIDNQVRTKFADFEVNEILRKAVIVLVKSKITFEELLDYPVEGYYYKSLQLRKYFKIIRNFQENKKIFDRVDIECEEFKYIKNITDKELFGKEKSDRMESMDGITSILPRRYDIIALTMRDENTNDPNSIHPWSMEVIINNLENKFTNTPNLVELAYLTKEKECLVCSAETNSLYRDFVCFSGCFIGEEPIIEYVWKVDKNVEDLGKRTVDEYNKISEKINIITPDLKNHLSLDKNAEKPRVARLGYVDSTGEWYYWILNNDGTVTEEYTRMEKTTESEKEHTTIDTTFFKNLEWSK